MHTITLFILDSLFIVQATIGAIVPGGAADLDGRLQVGDEITHINGQLVMDATHHEVIGLMSQAGTLGSVSLRIQRKMPQTGTCISENSCFFYLDCIHISLLLSDLLL